MSNDRRRRIICALIAAGSAAATLLLGRVRFFEILNHKAQDAHFVVRGQSSVPGIVLIVADQASLGAFPQLRMFWHRYYADAIRLAGASGARVIGLDLAFGVPVEKWEPGLDSELAGAVIESPVPVVVGYAREINFPRLAVPVNMYAASSQLDAFTNLTTDPDDFIRRQELFSADDPPRRSLALRVFEKYSGHELDPRTVPLDADRALLINYFGPPGSFPMVSLADVVAHAQEPEWGRAQFGGKIVLIGSVTSDDRFATPFFTPLIVRYNTAGVEIHANTIATLMERRFLRPPQPWLRVTALLVATSATAAIIAEISTAPAVVWMFTILVGIFGVTHLFFLRGVLLSTVEAVTACLICLIGTVICRFATAEERGALFRNAVSLFVSKDLAVWLEHTGSIGLSGRRLEVTILFTDIRGFTAFTEQVCDEQGPEVVVEMLNEYMSTMVAIIVRYHGHVNKFIGDGILAVFSDEDEGAVPGDHALRGVRCAMEMVNAKSRFKTGAGLHTGIAVVGNVGSADKMEYTVLGDTVNLASRLESLNKENKTNLLMSETTYSKLGGQVDAVLLGSVPVRGKAVPVNLYTVKHA